MLIVKLWNQRARTSTFDEKREAVYQKSDERQSAPLESTAIDSKLGHIEFVEEFLINYFAKIESPNFNAYEFYALEIDQYFTIKNTNPSFVNQEVRSADNDYQHKKQSLFLIQWILVIMIEILIIIRLM